MRQTIQGVLLGALVAVGVSVLLAQTPTWTAPRTWATDDLLTAGQFNAQFRDNLLWLRADATLTGTAALDDLGCGTRGTGQVLYSDCDWGALPAGVVFDIHDDVTQAATIANADRMPFSDENSSGDPMRYTSASNFAAYVRGTIPAGAVFDIHDNLTSATIADADRMAFSDEGSAGDPMRYTTAANIADYMQTEVNLSANRVTSDTFNTARIPNLSASKITSDVFAVARIPDLPADNLTSTNSPADGQVPSYDVGTGGFSWVDPFRLEWEDDVGGIVDETDTDTGTNRFVSCRIPASGYEVIGQGFLHPL